MRNLSFNFQATIHYKKPKHYRMTPQRRKICKPLIRRSYNSFAAKTMQNKSARKAIITQIGQLIHKEIVGLCSDKCDFILRNKSKTALKEFQFDTFVEQLRCHAPTLVSLFKSCLRTRTARRNSNLVLGLLIGIICKFRRQSCCLLQRIISLVLYAGHSSKKVSFS